MQTKASVAGHPIHSMLVAFPIGLYGATIGSLLAYVATSDGFFYRAAMTANIAAVIMAVVAAVPGLTDLFGLPKRSRTRQVAWQHAAFNVGALLLFTGSAALLYGRWTGRVMGENDWSLDAAAPLALALLGFVSTMIAGGLGWSLVQTHQVGVKPRIEPFRHAVSKRAVTRDEGDDEDADADADELATPTYGLHSHLHH